MELFDIIKLIFSNNKKWDEIGRRDKDRNFFMINRIMSIQFPVQANQFNKIRIVPHNVIDWWHRALKDKYTRIPNWIYTKTIKGERIKESAELDKEYNEAEFFIRNKFDLSKRELKELKEFYPKKYIKWIEEIDKQIKTSEN